jgi:glycogen synthase kinase 3 beta
MSADGRKFALKAKKLSMSEEEPDENVTLRFNEMELCGHGVFSNVYKGTVNENGHDVTVAIKKCWGTEKDKDSKEIQILKRLNRHKAKNVTKLLYFTSKSYDEKICFSLIMEFMPTTLSSHIRSTKPKPLPIIETKVFTWQMFRGLNWVHSNGIFHRDLKPQNILINPDTLLLQIGDFGSSVIIEEGDTFSSYHVTRYYRPIELLLGSHKYGPAIDFWSAGCVMAEMLRGRTFLPGKTTDNQLEIILECFGAPTESQLSAMSARKKKLLEKPDMVKAVEIFNERGQNGLRSRMPTAPDDAIKLLEEIFNYDPAERLHGSKLLGDPFFSDIFDSKREHNGKPLKLLTKSDLKKAVAGDVTRELKSRSFSRENLN